MRPISASCAPERKCPVKIVQSFTVARRAPAVWSFFQNVPAVAACLPGAELLQSSDDGVHRGKVAIKLGPFKAAFEGEAKVSSDVTMQAGHVEGRGTDKRGGSHSRMVLDYRLSGLNGTTKVDIDVDLTLSGPIAQFGRTGLVTEAANALMADFARNLEAQISGVDVESRGAPVRTQLNALSLIVTAVRAKLTAIFRRGAKGA
jgi:uncharacterized protein